MSLAVAMDIGGSSLRAALVDARGKIARAVRRELIAREPKAVLDGIERLVRDLEAPEGSPMAAGLAAVLKVKSGEVVVAPNLAWRDVPFGALLAERFGRPVRLVNDLDAIAMGEARCGAGRGAEDVVCVFVGTGVGMGAVVRGEVLEGAEGMATELGHIKIESVEAGRICGCGERGCLEAYTSGRHLGDLYAEKVATGVAGLRAGATLKADAIEAAAREGDRAARALWQDVGDRLGRAIGNLVTLFNPAVVVLGGGVLHAAASLRALVEERLRAYAGRAQMESAHVRDSELGDHAGLVGAGLLAHRA